MEPIQSYQISTRHTIVCEVAFCGFLYRKPLYINLCVFFIQVYHQYLAGHDGI